jgi:hypothetical protein
MFQRRFGYRIEGDCWSNSRHAPVYQKSPYIIKNYLDDVPGGICTPLLVLLLAAAQPGPPLPTDWKAFQSIPPGSRLVVHLHNREKIKGIFSEVSSDALVLTRGCRQERLDRTAINRVYRIAGRQGRRTLIGTAVAGGIGLGVGGYLYNQGDFVPSVVPVFGLIGAGMGALAGVLFGLRSDRSCCTLHPSPDGCTT